MHAQAQTSTHTYIYAHKHINRIEKREWKGENVISPFMWYANFKYSCIKQCTNVVYIVTRKIKIKKTLLLIPDSGQIALGYSIDTYEEFLYR